MAGARFNFRRGLLLLGVALLAGAAWRVYSLGMADHFARNVPGRALLWRLDHPLALARAAEQLADKRENPRRAEALARSALLVNPGSGLAYRVLGRLAEQRGDTVAAESFYEKAARLSPRDVTTRIWLEDHYLRAGKPAQALRNTDFLMRIEPQRAHDHYPLLRAMAAFPPAQPALAAALAAHPPWREDFLIRICQIKLGESAAVAPLITRLRQAPGGMTEQEISPWIDCLSRDKRWGEAYLNWVSVLPPERQAELANVFNGGFEREPSGSGFDWRITQAPGVNIDRKPTAGASGEVALRLSFDEGRVQFNNVRQLLALSPGRYRLTGRSRAEDLRSSRGLVWSVLCADGNSVVASVAPVLGSSPWREFSADFELPADRCQGQWLQLSVPARIRAEQRIGGRAWFDDLRIVRLR